MVHSFHLTSNLTLAETTCSQIEQKQSPSFKHLQKNSQFVDHKISKAESILPILLEKQQLILASISRVEAKVDSQERRIRALEENFDQKSRVQGQDETKTEERV